MTAVRRKKVSLTVAIDPEILKRARLRSIEQGTTVNAVVAAHLARYVDPAAEQVAAVDAFLETAERIGAEGAAHARKRGPRKWSREDLYTRG